MASDSPRSYSRYAENSLGHTLFQVAMPGWRREIRRVIRLATDRSGWLIGSCRRSAIFDSIGPEHNGKNRVLANLAGEPQAPSRSPEPPITVSQMISNALAFHAPLVFVASRAGRSSSDLFVRSAEAVRDPPYIEDPACRLHGGVSVFRQAVVHCHDAPTILTWRAEGVVDDIRSRADATRFGDRIAASQRYRARNDA